MRQLVITSLAGALLALTAPLPAQSLDALPVANWAGPVLAQDTRGDGRIVAVVGDLATADRIAILIPGVDTTLMNFYSGLGGVRRRAPMWQARQLAYQLDDPHTAVIAWLGYDTPEGVGLAAARSERATAGADALVAFLGQLTAHRPTATVTLIGHSYGSLVVAYAANRVPSQVRDLVFLASPGVDVARAADLHTSARVWAGTAPTDWTLRIPSLRIGELGHGVHPSDPAFGALPVDVHNADGHDGYFVAGTASLASIAAIVADAQLRAGAGCGIRQSQPSSPTTPAASSSDPITSVGQ